MREKAILLDAMSVERALMRVAHQIAEKNADVSGLCLIGIKTRGVPLAARIAKNIADITGVTPQVGTLDISLYRDDLTKVADAPIVREPQIPFSVEDKTVVLCDDVIYTGRTIRAAMDAIMDAGRPARIQLFELIDRGHRELPIRPDFVGKNVPTSHAEVITVRLDETDGETCVKLLEK
ncbi:MAG: bifunctional pyr operon transcriptional regulator/uracil phosphoribosyltransferase PyrR [Clostridia bacterium]|nr:bifunctional pyr operon transcriptional regulator/uracil phosphoribosyltransferase PyrR [Clostridia bacterium]